MVQLIVSAMGGSRGWTRLHGRCERCAALAASNKYLVPVDASEVSAVLATIAAEKERDNKPVFDVDGGAFRRAWEAAHLPPVVLSDD